jgi:hypothetical protein
MTMPGAFRRRTAPLWALGVIAAVLLLGFASPAVAECGLGGCTTPPAPAPAPAPAPTTQSSPTQYASYSSPSSSPSVPAVTCTVYANGGGMGSYCTSAGGDGVLKSLRERFGSQGLQRCRYSPLPEGIPKPFNARPGEGRYMMMKCLGNIDFDTYNGGPNRTLDVSMVFVPDGTDTADRHNGITDFLWNQFQTSTQLPVPFMRTRPNVVPVVGVPTFFTFRWLDPSDNSVVAQGPYAGEADGGPFRQLTSNGFVMRAQATGITVDPNQKGIASTTCRPDTPYREGATAAGQPAGACQITFPRSSASARTYATEPIPANVDDAFNVSVVVHWRVTYGRGGDMRGLGNGFTMRLHQVLPVQEVQAPNQPPAIVY